jgi:hypothetical protein
MRHSARPGVRWYRLAPPQVSCRACGAELRKVVRPVGWLLYTAMTLSAVIYVLYWFLHPQLLVRYHPWSVLGIVLAVIPFALLGELWGDTYVLARDKPPGHDRHAL